MWLILLSLMWSSLLAAEDVAPPPVLTENIFHRYEVNTFTGIHVTDESAAILGVQFGLAPVRRASYYVGPEVSMSLYPSGSLLEILFSGWVEIPIYGAPRLSLTGGVLLGVGIASNISSLSSVVAATYGELGLVQKVSEFINVKGAFRPGFVGGYYSFIMSLGITIRLA